MTASLCRAVFLKGDAQISGPLNWLPKGATLEGREGLVLRAQGDGKRYGLVLRTGGGDSGLPEQVSHHQLLPIL